MKEFIEFTIGAIVFGVGIFGICLIIGAGLSSGWYMGKPREERTITIGKNIMKFLTKKGKEE